MPDQPNIRIHADLFGPMLAAGRQHKYILCITDAFTKYAIVTPVENKEAETVAKAIFSEWFCKFGIPAQIHTDGGKEFVNKLSNELFSLLNVSHTKTTPAHPQCNAQVEVFNKTVKKYLASFVDDTTLDWENFLPATLLQLAGVLDAGNSWLPGIQDTRNLLRHQHFVIPKPHDLRFCFFPLRGSAPAAAVLLCSGHQVAPPQALLWWPTLWQ